MIELDPEFIRVVRGQELEHPHHAEHVGRGYDNCPARVATKSVASRQQPDACCSNVCATDAFEIEELVEAGVEQRICPETLLVVEQIVVSEDAPGATEYYVVDGVDGVSRRQWALNVHWRNVKSDRWLQGAQGW